MEAAEQSFQRDLQHVKFCDMKLHATIWSGSEGAYKLNGKRKDLVDGAVQLESLALGLKRDVLERSIGGRTGVEVVADVSYVGVDDAFLDLKNEGLWVVEGRIDLPAGANHLSTNPADIDAEVGAFAKEQIVRVDQGGARSSAEEVSAVLTGPRAATEGDGGGANALDREYQKNQQRQRTATVAAVATRPGRGRVTEPF